jgi:hypothetical protein
VTSATRTALGLALGSLLLYQANAREVSSQDTVPNRVLPYELVRHQRLTLDRLFHDWPARAPLPYWVQRAGGHYVSSYPVAPAILAVPVYLVPLLLADGGEWVVLNALSKLAASLFAALSVACVYLAARELARRGGASPASALATALVYAVATPTWAVSSQGLWGRAPAPRPSAWRASGSASRWPADRPWRCRCSSSRPSPSGRGGVQRRHCS